MNSQWKSVQHRKGSDARHLHPQGKHGRPRAHLAPVSLEHLQQSRSSLRTILYTMEHDCTVDTRHTRVAALRSLLLEIERQISTLASLRGESGHVRHKAGLPGRRS